MSNRKDIEKLQQVIAYRVKTFRTAAGLTQEQLSEKAGIAPQYLSRLETARQVPSLETVGELARALNISPDALLAEPQEHSKAEHMARLAAVFDALDEEDAAFLESQITGWITYLQQRCDK